MSEILSDDRTCSCGCGSSTGQVCNARAHVYSGSGCNGTPTDTVLDNGQCTNTSDAYGDSLYFDIGTWTGGSCAPTSIEGSVSFGVTEQLCCRP